MRVLAPAHWAETDYGLSAGQHSVLPEELRPMMNEIWLESSQLLEEHRSVVQYKSV